MNPDKCARRGHETAVPVFEHPKFGGVMFWRCMCGAAVSTKALAADRGKAGG